MSRACGQMGTPVSAPQALFCARKKEKSFSGKSKKMLDKRFGFWYNSGAVARGAKKPPEQQQRVPCKLNNGSLKQKSTAKEF